jgi:hypothetical protein
MTLQNWQNLAQISFTVPFSLRICPGYRLRCRSISAERWALSHAFLRKALSNGELRDRARDHDIGGHIFLTTWSLFSLRLDSFVISSSPLSHLLSNFSFQLRRFVRRVVVYSSAVPLLALVPEWMREKEWKATSEEVADRVNIIQITAKKEWTGVTVTWMLFGWRMHDNGFFGGYFWSISWCSQNVGMIHRNILAKFGCKRNIKVKLFKTCFYVFGYILEPCIQICIGILWFFFLNPRYWKSQEVPWFFFFF